jgi:LPS sulfotransferase NodH
MGARPRSQEFFGKDFIHRQRDFVPDTDAPVQSYIRHITKPCSVRGVLGIKLLYNQLELFMKYKDFPAVLAGQKIVYLYRSNVIKQAISYYFAMQTQQWTSVANRPPAVEISDVKYDFSAIRGLVARLERQNSYLRRFLIVNQLEYLTICYEDYVADSEAAGERVMQHLGIEPRAGEILATEGFASQSTGRNREFYDQFLSDERVHDFGDGSFMGAPLFR